MDLDEYWKKRRALEADFNGRNAADEAAVMSQRDKIKVIISEIRVLSAGVNTASGDFIEFFVKNRDLLPPEFSEYINTWLDEHQSIYGDLAIKSANLRTELQVRRKLIGDVAQRKRDFAVKLHYLIASLN